MKNQKNLLKKAVYLSCLVTIVCLTSCISAKMVGYHPTKEELEKYYLQYFSKNDLATEIKENLPLEPKIYFPGKSDYSFDNKEDVNEVVYNKASSEYYRIMGYGSYYPRGYVSLYDGPELASHASKDIIQYLTEFCIEKGGYELYIQNQKEYLNKYTVDTSSELYSLNNTLYSSSESTVKQESVDIITYYVITPFSKEEIALWKLGMEVRDIEKEERNKLGRNTGVIVDMIYEKFPGFKANLRKGDIIIQINDSEIDDIFDYSSFEKSLNRGDTVTITFIREGIVQNVSTKIR